MYRNFDESRVLVPSQFRNLAAPSHLILAAATLWGVIAAAAPATAARPADPYKPYVGLYTGSEPENDKYISTRFDKEDGSYLLSSSVDWLNPYGVAQSSARVSEVRYGDVYWNPDLHASVSGEAKSVGYLSGSMDASVDVSFRDIITIKELPPGIIHGYPFVIDFTYDGALVGTGDKYSASRGWVGVGLNFSLSDLDQPNIRASSGAGFSTLPKDEVSGGYQGGVDGAVAGEIKMRLNVKAGARLMIEGSIDMYGNASGGDPAGATFNADFSNSVRFNGIHIYTDDTLTTELTGYTIDSAFGFDYRVNVVPEPASFTQLAIVGVLFGALRRNWLPSAAFVTSSDPDSPVC